MHANSPRKRPVTPPVCPVCGEDVPRNALACPECGADHRSGWREDAASHDGTGLPDEGDFDYDEYVKREFGGISTRGRTVKPVWVVTALVLLAAFAWIAVHLVFFF